MNSIEELKKVALDEFKLSCCDLVREEADLWTARANEWSKVSRLFFNFQTRMISQIGRIAEAEKDERMRARLRRIRVDCEWSRAQNVKFQEQMIAKRIGSDGRVGPGQGILRRPDIIVHERLDGGTNLLVVEAKPSGISSVAFRKDIVKLSNTKWALGYAEALLVELGSGQVPSIRVYRVKNDVSWTTDLPSTEEAQQSVELFHEVPGNCPL